VHALAGRDAGIVAVLFCDVDSLEAINDSRGHAAGDRVLRQVASRITATLRPADTIARPLVGRLIESRSMMSHRTDRHTVLRHLCRDEGGDRALR
jgi:diguanylate cyclase (GGDEF)-like protein